MRLAGLANLPVVEHPAGVVAFGQRVDIRGQDPQAKDSHQNGSWRALLYNNRKLTD